MIATKEIFILGFLIKKFTYVSLKGKSQYKETINFEIPDSLNNDLNFKIILDLLKKNIKH